MKQAHEELQRQLSALRSRFTDTGQRAAAAARAMRNTVLPPADLIESLAETGRAFVKLRSSLLQQVAPLTVPDARSLTSLAHLESVLQAAIEAEEHRLRQAAWEQARETALATLDRVMALLHREDPGFAGLVACQANAREMQLALGSQQPDDPQAETANLHARVRSFAELVALVDGWDVLDDDRCAFLQDTITQAFGRPLALAALRGKLGNEGDVLTPAPEPMRAPAAQAPEPAATADPERVSFAAATVAPEPVVAPVVPPPKAPAVVQTPPASPAVPAGTPIPPGGPAFIIERIKIPNAAVPPHLASPPLPAGTRPPAQPVVASAPSSTVAQIRLTSEKVQAETSEDQRRREARLEAMAAQKAQWWVAARKGWNEFQAGGASFTDLAKDMLKRYPFLLSVPIQKSAEHEGGRLAEGYALLLQHVEKQEEGFVKEALTRLNPQFTAQGEDQTYQLGQELYLYVVAEGRLYKTYPDFVKEVMARVIPEPGLWVQGGLTERVEETASFTRADAAGTQGLKLSSLTDAKERAAPQVFGVGLGPLTTRFFKVEAGELPDTPDVEIKLKENDSASDRAWIVGVPTTGKPEAPKKQKAGGTVVPELGKQHRLVWIGVFNPDPNNDKRYELTITLKRKPRATAPAAATFAPPKPSPFAPRKK